MTIITDYILTYTQILNTLFPRDEVICLAGLMHIM